MASRSTATTARKSTDNTVHGSCEGETQHSPTKDTPILTRVTLKEDQPLRDVIPPSCDGYFNFGNTKTRKTDQYKGSKVIEKPLPKPEQYEEPPRCKLCHKILYEHEHEICETCRHRQVHKYFKGVPGLQDLPLSKIALLPQGARALYLKHMDCAEADQLNAIIRKNNGS